MKPTPQNMLVFLVLLLVASPAAAHFPWLAISPDGKVIYFFGEHPADRTYHMPPPIAKAKVQVIGKDNETLELKMEGVKSDGFVGMHSSGVVKADATLRSQVTYGIYQGSRLNYYTIHRGGSLPTNRDAYQEEPSLDLNAQLVDTDSGVDVFVLWKGKPLAGVDVQLFCEEGHEEGKSQTDAQGKVSFTDKQVEDGLNGIMLGHTVKGESGEIDGKPYEAVSHYLTATFVDPQDFVKKAEAKTNEASQTAPNAEVLRLAAHGSRAVWDNFPGFSADITIAADSDS